MRRWLCVYWRFTAVIDVNRDCINVSHACTWQNPFCNLITWALNDWLAKWLSNGFQSQVNASMTTLQEFCCTWFPFSCGYFSIVEWQRHKIEWKCNKIYLNGIGWIGIKFPFFALVWNTIAIEDASSDMKFSHIWMGIELRHSSHSLHAIRT